MRAESNISARSLRSADKHIASRKSSGEWKPKEVSHPKAAAPSEIKFQRIDETKFTHLKGSEADYSYEAKAKYGQTGDTYGDWSN